MIDNGLVQAMGMHLSLYMDKLSQGLDSLGYISLSGRWATHPMNIEGIMIVLPRSLISVVPASGLD
jgi:aryl carrier-like protein